MEDLSRYLWLPNESQKSVRNRQPAVRPKNWQKNPSRKKQSGGRYGSNGRIEKLKNPKKRFNSILGNIPEQSILENFQENFHDRDKLVDLSLDFKNNGVLQVDEIPFVSKIDQSEFSHTFPKPIGWGRKKVNLGKTISLDTRNSMEYINALDSCLGILHSKMDPIKKPECAFCKRNNAKDIYHLLKDEFGGVVCPVLSAFTCKMCAATGRNAHTHKYCPINPITKGDPVAAGMPPGRPLTKADKEWLKYFQTKYLLQVLDGSRTISQ